MLQTYSDDTLQCVTTRWVTRIDHRGSSVQLLCHLLKRGAFARLTTLALPNNGIGDHGLKALAEACRANGALDKVTVLELQSNKIGDDGMNAFADAVGEGALASLKTLSLANNLIGDDGP